MKTQRQFFATPPIDTEELSIHAIGIQEHMPPCVVNRPGGTGDYLFMFFYDEVLIEADGRLRTYPPNSLIIWDPAHGHHYGNPHHAWNHSWLHGDGTSVARLLQAAEIPCNTVLPFPSPALVEKYLLAMYTEVMDYAAPEAAIVRNCLHNWLLEVRRVLRRAHDPHAVPARFREVKRHIEEHYQTPITLGELAERLHLSVPYFSGEFKRHFGVPAIDYLISLRLHQAAYLLRNQNLSVTEVARQVGYGDLYYFSKLFKKYYGVSPRQMRQGLR